MIIDFHPDNPTIKDGRKYIGYWHSITIDPKTLKLGKPGHDFNQYQKFGLPVPNAFIDNGWSPADRFKIVNYLKQGKVDNGWMGWSWCRFGCPDDLGSTDLTDGTYVWPEGFAHYVEKHGVKPPQEFLQHVLGK